MNDIATLETEAIDRLCELLNNEIRKSGAIQKGNKNIWAVLHEMDNTIWQHCLNGARAITTMNHRNYNRIDQRITELESAIKRLSGVYDNVITPYPSEYKKQKRPNSDLYQGAAWHLLMLLREVYCDNNNLDLPNK
jgi:hypothetical protein